MNLAIKQKGVAAVEFGLLLIPLVTLAFGITEFGRAMYQYNGIVKSERDAVRFLSQAAPGDATARVSAGCLVVYGNRTCSGNPLVAGLTVGHVTVRDSTTDAATHALQQVSGGGGATGVANLVSVEVSGYKFSSLVTYVVPDITFNTISATMVQPL